LYIFFEIVPRISFKFVEGCKG